MILKKVSLDKNKLPYYKRETYSKIFRTKKGIQKYGIVVV